MPIPLGKLLKPNWRGLATGWMLLMLAACASDETVLTPKTFADLPGWQEDTHLEPLKLFADSCVANRTRPAYFATKSGEPIGEPEQWQILCSKAEAKITEETLTDRDARIFFEAYFTPYQVNTERYPQALITGYYEPIIRGSMMKTEQFKTPVYGVPDDLGTRKPYYSRAEIEAGAMQDHAPILLYVDDPVMLFFLQIQGSGKVELTDGSLVGLQYAAQNGQPYVAIGKIIKEREDLDTVTMQIIRDWLHQHPDEAAEVMNQNPSYVFFTLASGEAYPKGALGLPLTPLRSIAVDNQRSTYGLPVYINTTTHPTGTEEEAPLARLFVSQDTGGALHGPHRTDIFFGRGEQAEAQAGPQNAAGDVYWLLPTPPAPIPEKPATPEVPRDPFGDPDLAQSGVRPSPLGRP